MKEKAYYSVIDSKCEFCKYKHSVHTRTLIALTMEVSLLQYCLMMWRVAMP